MQRTVTQHVDQIGKWLQAYMLETARLRPDARVLEIGSGGYNAALIVEIVGDTGVVVGVDIDADIVANARAGLDRAGYPQVQVVHADGEHGHPGGAPYDAVIVTVEASDVPPAWTDQLAPEGTLVVPLRLRGNVRCLTLRRCDDHLVAAASLQCGFVSMQGLGRDPVRRVYLLGDDAVLGLDDSTTQVDPGALRAALHGPRTQVWSPVTVPMDASIEALQLFLASQPRPYGVLTVDRNRTAGLLDPQDRFFCPTLLTSHSFAYLTLRKYDDATWQFGAHGFGPDAATLTHDLISLVAVWNQQYRARGGPRITVHRAGALLSSTDALRLLVPRRHRLIALTWPGGSR